MRPILLSGGLALIWFVQFQESGIEGDVPVWGIAAVLAVRLLADFIGVWLALSTVRLAFVLARLGLVWLSAGR